jgi:hypothetical protein
VSVARYPLEHFYYGQTNRDSQPRLLAASQGVPPELAAAAVERAAPSPLPDPGTWALVRGNRQLPFLLVHSRLGISGQTIAHYILMPSDVLRAMGGNLRALLPSVQAELPAESTKLHMLEISPPAPESTEQQIEDILDLMTTTQNRMEVMESLLAAIVRGVQIIIQGAPNELNQRIHFISGILALLPPSVRYAVTFATHSTRTPDIDVQIRFYSDEPAPRDTLVYNWKHGTLTGQQVEDDYSRFVMSQLRLDTSLVIERTRALTPMTGWRMRQGDRLGDALAYGSHRQKLDTALLNNQPVDKDEVAKVLREDPTLDDALRIAYGRHLLTFSLAMDDIQHADPIIDFISASPELESAAFQQMFDALNDKQAGTVYKLIARWMAGTRMSDTERWVSLAHRAAVTHVDHLAANQSIDLLNAFLVYLIQAVPTLHIERIIGRLVEKMLPLTPQDAGLAENVFLLAVAHMDTQRFKRLLEMKPFIGQLQPQVTQALKYLNGVEVGQPPQNVLGNAARTFGEQWEPLVLVRFAELARLIGRFDLLDEKALQNVVQVAASPLMPAHYEQLGVISERPAESDLPVIGAKNARYLLQIRLALGDYAGLAGQMIQQSANLYRGDLQTEYIRVVERVFAETPISAAKAEQAVEEIGKYGIKSAPLVMAAIGALQNRAAAPELDRLADRIEGMLAAEPQLLSVIPGESILSLLRFHVQKGNASSAQNVADLISLAAAHHSDHGLQITAQMYRLMAENRATRAAALNLLRVFVRQAEDRAARQAVAYYGRELGSNVRSALEATYLVKQVLNGSDLAAYAASVQRIVAFLQDAAAAYNERSTPTTDDLTLRLNTMRDTLLREERRIFTRALMAMMKGIVTLQQQQRSSRSPDVSRLLNASADPTTALDVLRVIAGYFSEGKRVDLKLRASLPTPLGERTRKFLRDEIMAGSEVVSNLLRAVPADARLEVKADHIRGAVESLYQNLSPDAKREVGRILGSDLQKLTALIELIGEKGDPKAVEEGGLGDRIDEGRHRPRSALEYMRFLYGYHLTKG